jgi:hypothetical protein
LVWLEKLLDQLGRKNPPVKILPWLPGPPLLPLFSELVENFRDKVYQVG